MRLLLVKLLLTILMISPMQKGLSNDTTYNTVSVISSEKFLELRESLDLERTKKTLRPKEREKDKTEEDKKKKKKKNNKLDLPFLGHIGQIIAFSIIAILVIAILYFVFSNVEIEKKINPSDIPDYIEDIEEIDTISAFGVAMAEGNYRVALRMRFLRVLQILSEKNMIKWKPEKTNRNYNRELRGTEVSTAFSKMSHIFDYVWYGNKEIDRATFEDMDKDYKTFLSRYNV